MLCRRLIISKTLPFLKNPSLISSSKHHHLIQNKPLRNPPPFISRFFSTNNNGSNDDIWKIISPSNEENDIFKETEEKKSEKEIMGGENFDIGNKGKEEGVKDVVWKFVEGGNENDVKDEIFDIGNDVNGGVDLGNGVSEFVGFDGKVEESGDNDEKVSKEEDKLLEIEENALKQVLEGPNHAFGDLIAASGITDDMLDSLMALKDLDDVPGLPPLSTIEDMRYQKNTNKSTRADIERQKQEEIAKSRVRQVDSEGRAYGTGKRKCSIARVWIEPGDGKFVINDKQFDAYFPMLDQRAALLRPLSETKTLGLLDISCTVKGGGMSGQIGAIRLGMSRALQNWAPDQFRPPLKEAGFLTRDSRIVERKKPGKAKARKSFQWVKR
uniref:30S ribosomal protein S9, mitochondrial n=1 Tax=Erigeron canadensis TaxID=72917 RepID=UPI001CB940ED|nr:30S ribosomal protein S9, mitochondrial [Erigeron canadensis]